VKLATFQLPAINPRYLSDETDRRAIISGYGSLGAAPPRKQFVGDEGFAGDQVRTDDELLDSARRNGSTSYHASCTCMMGSFLLIVARSTIRLPSWFGSRGRLGC
jgi:choline dehydrogenase